MLISAISPRPKISGVRARTRRAESATLLTGSPYKAELERKQKAIAASSSAKAGKTAAKTAAPLKTSRGQKRKINIQKDDAQPSTSTAREKKSAKHQPDSGPRRKPTAAAAKKSGRKKRSAAHESGDSSSEDEEWPCIICGEPFANSKSREKWIQCQDCNKWAHEACTDGSRFFICPNCDSESD